MVVIVTVILIVMMPGLSEIHLRSRAFWWGKGGLAVVRLGVPCPSGRIAGRYACLMQFQYKYTRGSAAAVNVGSQPVNVRLPEEADWTPIMDAGVGPFWVMG